MVDNAILREIGHNLSNLLTAIIGNVTMIRMERALNDDMLDVLEETEASAWEAAELTKRLLTLAAKQENETEETVGNRSAQDSQARRILFVDDEEMVCKTTSRLLKQLGYLAVVVRNGAEALATYREALQAEKSFLAVIIDLNLTGGLTGEQVVAKLREMDPDIRAIATSGGVHPDEGEKFRRKGFAGILAKPFRLAELKAALDAVLGAD